MSEAVSTASDWLRGRWFTWLSQGAKFLSIIFILSALISDAKLTGKKKICCSVMSLPFHFFSICVWLLEQKWLFLEGWGENKNSPGQYYTTESQLCSSRMVHLTLMMRKGQITPGSMEVGSLSPLLHLMETCFCVHGRCHFLQEGKKSPN